MFNYNCMQLISISFELVEFYRNGEHPPLACTTEVHVSMWESLVRQIFASRSLFTFHFTVRSCLSQIYAQMDNDGDPVDSGAYSPAASPGVNSLNGQQRNPAVSNSLLISHAVSGNLGLEDTHRDALAEFAQVATALNVLIFSQLSIFVGL